MGPKAKYKLVFSDFHLGGGARLPDGTTNYLENFFYDEEFIELIQYYSEGVWKDQDCEIILNGDFFEHIQVVPGEKDPDLMTEAVAVWRQKKIIEGHKDVFEAFRRFNELPQHRITFNLGNHDAGLLWPGVHKVLQEAIGGDVRVLLEPYYFDGVRIEHGHRYHADSAFNESRYFLEKGLDEPIINMPWGCYFVTHFVNKVRRDRPSFSRIHPMRYYLRWAIIHEPIMALKHMAMILYYFISLRFVHSKRRHSSFWRTLKIIKESARDQSLDSAAKKLLLTNPDIKIVIMGHAHGARYRYYAQDKLYINTGTWTERISLDPSHLGRAVRLTYATIEIEEEGTVKASLSEWVGRHEVSRDICYA